MRLKTNKRFYLWIVLLIFVATTVFVALYSVNKNEYVYKTMYMYKDPNCGCCNKHAKIVEKSLGVKVEKINTKQLALVKQKYNISPEVQSCHTLVFEDKFAEGHVPVSELRRFFFENQYDGYKGISLPGMPAGSPGMPGIKTQTFKIYGISENGSYELINEI